MISPTVPRVVVVGAGFGGLACAVDLAASGFHVQVVERAAGPGGKARARRVGTVEMDGGPTVLTMPWVFEELFADAGRSFSGAVALSRTEVLARHAWRDGVRLDLYADRAASADAIGRVFGAAQARAYVDFCADARRIYETVEAPFLRSQRPTMAAMFKQAGSLGLSALGRIDAFRTMWRALVARFDEPRLRQLFGRYATYCGSSPFEAPATLNLVSHVEAEGVFRVSGGLAGLASALEDVARDLGVEFHYGRRVRRIRCERGRAAGVECAAELYPADAVVWNGDVSAVREALDGTPAVRAPGPVDPEDRSLSAVTFAMVGAASGFPLVHHNVFFSDDYASEFDSLLRLRRVPEQPTVYVCAQDRFDDERELADERLLVLVNAPATGDSPQLWDERERDRCERLTERMLNSCGLRLAPARSVVTTPADYHRAFPGTGGALYGPIARGSLSALSRQAASTRVPRLYLAGGSVHPGPGVPMATLSGRLAAARVRADLGSTARSRTAGTSGTTSTA